MLLLYVEPRGLIFDDTRTESSALYLLCCEGKHREQFCHDLNDDVCQYFCRWNVDIDVEAFQEITQAFKEVEERIIARADFTGSLTYPCVIRDRI
jgi:hypothetical protein